MDIEIAFDAEFVFPVLFPFVSGILSDHNHLGDIGQRFVRPSPWIFGDALD